MHRNRGLARASLLVTHNDDMCRTRRLDGRLQHAPPPAVPRIFWVGSAERFSSGSSHSNQRDLAPEVPAVRRSCKQHTVIAAERGCSAARLSLALFWVRT